MFPGVIGLNAALFGLVTLPIAIWAICHCIRGMYIARLAIKKAEPKDVPKTVESLAKLEAASKGPEPTEFLSSPVLRRRRNKRLPPDEETDVPS